MPESREGVKQNIQAQNGSSREHLGHPWPRKRAEQKGAKGATRWKPRKAGVIEIFAATGRLGWLNPVSKNEIQLLFFRFFFGRSSCHFGINRWPFGAFNAAGQHLNWDFTLRNPFALILSLRSPLPFAIPLYPAYLLHAYVCKWLCPCAHSKNMAQCPEGNAFRVAPNCTFHGKIFMEKYYL